MLNNIASQDAQINQVTQNLCPFEEIAILDMYVPI